jgi:hypothetical protein
MTDHTRDSRLKTLTPQDVKDTTIVDVDELDTTDIATGAGDSSPHLGGRAQPGDILGIETAGETTAIGDTTEDENERRRDLEKAAAKASESERSDRKLR